MSENWQKLDGKKSQTILQEINQHITPVPFNEEQTILRTQPLPFYEGYQLIELSDMSAVPGAKKYAVYAEGDVNMIDWSNQVIYDTNEKAPIHLTEQNVADYVKFFFSYVRGRHGRFLVIETVDDVRWQVEPPMQGRKVMQEMLCPVSLKGKTEDDAYELEVFMVFKDSLFKSKVIVQPGGAVDMFDEELMIEGLPIMQDTAA